MPVALRWKGYKFFFFSNEGNPREEVHVHVRKGEAVAKVWLKPVVNLASSYHLSSKELKEILKVIEDNTKLIERKWNEHFA